MLPRGPDRHPCRPATLRPWRTATPADRRPAGGWHDGRVTVARTSPDPLPDSGTVVDAADAEAIRPDSGLVIDRPVMRQRWRHLVYVHWAYPPAVVQRLLPDHLRVDVMAGAAWVGLVPFVMTDVRVGGLPPIPWLSSFVEVNIRTYVIDRAGGRRVWFSSLDVPRLAPMAVARAAYGLRYCWSAASWDLAGDVLTYRTRRRLPGPRGAGADLRVEINDPLPDGEVTDLEHFLSARWGLSATWVGRELTATLLHERWPLQRARLLGLDQSLTAAAGLPTPHGDPLVHYAAGVDVTVSRPFLEPAGDPLRKGRPGRPVGRPAPVGGGGDSHADRAPAGGDPGPDD